MMILCLAHNFRFGESNYYRCVACELAKRVYGSGGNKRRFGFIVSEKVQ